jgi:hypothetical protein
MTGSNHINKGTLDNYKLLDAVSLFSQQITIVNNLWTVYVVATFAAAGFGASSLPSYQHNTSLLITIGLSIGYWAFTLGHFRLLMQALSIKNQLKLDIADHLATGINDNGIPFRNSLLCLINTVNPPWIVVCIHIVIDLCVTFIIWIRILLI